MAGCFVASHVALADLITSDRPKRVLIVIDTGRGWQIATYGPENHGPPLDEKITIQATMQEIEERLVALRRENDFPVSGETITDPERIVQELRR